MNRKRDHYCETGKTLSFAELSAELTRLKHQPETAWLREMHAQSMQQALRDLDSAYQHFFRLAPRVDRLVQTHVGIDVGLKSLAVLSTGETIDNPRWYRTQTRKLRRAQKALSRKVKGSRNRGKARIVVARLHQKIGNQRKDFLHKLSTDLICHFDLVSIEDLNVRGLAKTKLSKSVLDAGWGMFRSMLIYKADRNDIHLIAIGRFFPFVQNLRRVWPGQRRSHPCGSRMDMSLRRPSRSRSERRPQHRRAGVL